MNWEKDAEHMHDYGHTWGPGIDDYVEPTEEEQLASSASFEAYKKELEVLRVDARETYAETGKKFNEWVDEYSKKAGDWREEYSKKQMDACQKAAEELGYSFGLRDGNEDRNKFIISVEYYGFLSGRGGNIHHFAASGIDNPEKCLQLVADFKAIGCRTTTFYQDYFCSIDDTARLRKEMETWGVSFDKKEMIEKEVKALASALNEFAEDFYTYEERNQATMELEKNIKEGNIHHIQNWHNDINLEDCEYDVVLKSKTLMKWLENVEKKLYGNKKISLDAKIQNAEKKCEEVNKEKMSHEKSHDMER